MYKEYEAPQKIKECYDYIVLGSDQIWNFTFDKIFSDKALGAFVPSEKRVSFSASFGVNYIPKEGSEEYRLSLIHILSICRSNGMPRWMHNGWRSTY